MVILFKDLRDKVAKTDCISIMVTSTGDGYDSYLSIEMVPQRFNELPVMGFGSVDGIDLGKEYPLMRGTEFLLYDGPYIEWDLADDTDYDPLTPEERQKCIDDYIKSDGKKAVYQVQELGEE